MTNSLKDTINELLARDSLIDLTTDQKFENLNMWVIKSSLANSNRILNKHNMWFWFQFFSDRNIIAGLAALCFSILSKIQSLAIPKLLAGNGNIAIIDATGSGKTLAYAIAAVNHVDPMKKHPQVLCICNCYETAIQTSLLFNALAMFTDVKIGDAIKDDRGIVYFSFANSCCVGRLWSMLYFCTFQSLCRRVNVTS